jgi:hypothetical protein
MLQGLEAKKRRRVAAKIGNYFSDQGKHLTHRRPIFRKEAKAQGVVIQDIEEDKLLAEMIREYYYRWELLFGMPTPVTKIFQSETELIVKHAPVVFVGKPVKVPQPPSPKKQSK